MHTYIVGCGYLGKRLAHFYLQQGEQVHALVRSEHSAQLLQTLGINVNAINLDQSLPGLQEVADSLLYYLAPPPKNGGEESRVEHFLQALEQQNQLPRRIVYLSTTGVYGDCHGEWVDEQRPVRPVAERARRRWHGEQQIRRWGKAQNVPVVILRVAGFYGPGKLPLNRLRRGEPLVSEAEAPFTNRIYVDDLVQVCVAAAEHGEPGEVYNVSDGSPGNMTDYFNQVADFSGLARPPQISLAEAEEKLSQGMLSYLRESRRLDNRKMLDQLKVKLKYPTLASGLQAIGKEGVVD